MDGKSKCGALKWWSGGKTAFNPCLYYLYNMDLDTCIERRCAMCRFNKFSQSAR